MCKLSYILAAPRRPKLALADSPLCRAAGRSGDPDGAEPLSLSVRALFAMIALAAEGDEPCPSNRAFAGALGFSSVGQVSAMLNRIQAAGLIRIERGQTSRIVTILASGKRTAGEPGRIRWRHQPQNMERRRVKHGDGRPRKRAEREASVGALSARIARDPCFHCGVRADIGCAHQRKGSRMSPSVGITPASSKTSGGICESGGN